MRRLLLSGVVAMTILIATGSADAQSGGGRTSPRPSSPTLSPYLNLLRSPNRGGGLGFNYYMRTRPQQNAIRLERSVSQSLSQLQRRQSSLQQELDTGLSPTGHQTSFLNLGAYYPTTRR